MGLLLSFFCRSFFPGKDNVWTSSNSLFAFRLLKHALKKRNPIHKLRIQKTSCPTGSAEKHDLYFFLSYLSLPPFCIPFQLWRWTKLEKSQLLMTCKGDGLTSVTGSYSQQDSGLRKLSSNNCSARFEWTSVNDVLHLDTIHNRRSKAQSLASPQKRTKPVQLKSTAEKSDDFIPSAVNTCSNKTKSD